LIIINVNFDYHAIDAELNDGVYALFMLISCGMIIMFLVVV